MGKRNSMGLFILSVVLLGLPITGVGQEKAPTETPESVTEAPSPEKAPAPTPDPKQVLRQMCEGAIL